MNVLTEIIRESIRAGRGIHSRGAIATLAMIAAGAPADRMDITSHGESNLLVISEDNVAEPLNRRVEVTIR